MANTDQSWGPISNPHSLVTGVKFLMTANWSGWKSIMKFMTPKQNEWLRKEVLFRIIL